MKLLPISKSAVVKLDDADYAYYSQWRWKLGTHGYACRTGYQGGKYGTFLLHRLICGTPKDMVTDHINGDKLDNQRANLRIVTKSQNNRNLLKPPVTNTTGFLGVSTTRNGKYRAYGKNELGKYKHLGVFATALEAFGTAREYKESFLPKVISA